MDELSDARLTVIMEVSCQLAGEARSGDLLLEIADVIVETFDVPELTGIFFLTAAPLDWCTP